MTEVRGLDLTGAYAPALSTTSDMPKPGIKPTPLRGAVSEEELKAVGTGVLGKADEKPDREAAATEKQSGDSSPQKREIDQVRSREREAEARATALSERLDKTLAALEKAATRTDTTVKTEPADPRPRRFDFDDPDTYDDALVAWSAKAAAKVTQAQIERQTKERAAEETKSRTERTQQAQFQERMAAWKSAKDKAVEQYSDYQEVTEADDLPITPAMAFAIVEENFDSGKGYEIAYYLGKHPEEAKKIAALSTPSKQELAIGKLAERLASAKPANAVRSRANASRRSTGEESMEEYAARRNAELRGKEKRASVVRESTT